MSKFLNLYIAHEDDPVPTNEEEDIQSETITINLDHLLYARRVCQGDGLLYVELHFPGEVLRVTSWDYEKWADPVHVLDRVLEKPGHMLTMAGEREQG